MEWVVKIVLIVMVLIMVFFVYKKLISEYEKQKQLIVELKKKIREEKSVYDAKAYSEKSMYYKEHDWLRQRNRGKDPCDLKKKIKLRDYSNGCQFIVLEKGL